MSQQMMYQLPRQYAAAERRARRGVQVCKSCRAVNYQKHWRHDSEKMRLERRLSNIQVEHVLCPACTMVKTSQYEAKVIIRGVPRRFAPELVGLITTIGRKAWNKDPEDRVISIRKDGDDVVLTTTESRLAVFLAKKIRDAFKRVSLDVRYAKETHDATLIRVHFAHQDVTPLFN
jgi:NMD protein affecting ribosome stability and mRNA decay